jgi:DNA repair exonuclease SbcCD ATPase subunit
MLDKNLSIDRTPQLIAIEINSIKEQTRKMVLFNSIEIGRRLSEAKSLVPHGEWGGWLSKSVDYSQRTASNLMAIFEQYGSSQITFFCDNAKSQALANLSYTQAVALLGIPQDEREAFLQENDLDSMSTRELQQAIKEKQELEAKLKEIEAGWINSRKAADDAKQLAVKKTQEAQELAEDISKLRQQLSREKDQSESLKTQLAEAHASGNDDEVKRVNELLQESNSELFAAQKKIEELERQLKETPVEVTAAPVIEKVPEEVERELNELRQKNKELESKESQPINTATIRFKVHFDSLVKGFGDLLGVLDEIDVDARDKYKNAVKGLISKMLERL